MPNDISLTARIPLDLDNRLSDVSEFLGITKSNLIRESIHRCLGDGSLFEKYVSTSSEKHRIVLNVNHNTYRILEQYIEKNNVSVNNAIIFAIYKSVEHYSKVMKGLHQ